MMNRRLFLLEVWEMSGIVQFERFVDIIFALDERKKALQITSWLCGFNLRIGGVDNGN